jgi:hypothetical protein
VSRDTRLHDIACALGPEAPAAAGETRLHFLRGAARAGGATLAGGGLLGALAPGALAAGAGLPPADEFGRGDIGILNFLLMLEYLEQTFYDRVVELFEKHRPNWDFYHVEFLARAQLDEGAHADFLRSLLRRHAIKRPQFNLTKVTTDQGQFTTTAYALENLVCHAYLGQLPNIQRASYLSAVASLLAVDGRHAGVVSLVAGHWFPGLRNGWHDTPFSAAEVLAGVRQLGFLA